MKMKNVLMAIHLICVARCWITDHIVHWVVNIGCYALVFLFTFTTFIIIFTLLIRHKKANTGSDDVKRNSTSVMLVFGLCSILGVSWGFVFFAYGVLRIPAYYIFSVLSSFQGTLSVLSAVPTVLSKSTV